MLEQNIYLCELFHKEKMSQMLMWKFVDICSCWLAEISILLALHFILTFACSSF